MTVDDAINDLESYVLATQPRTPGEYVLFLIRFHDKVERLIEAVHTARGSHETP